MLCQRQRTQATTTGKKEGAPLNSGPGTGEKKRKVGETSEIIKGAGGCLKRTKETIAN